MVTRSSASACSARAALWRAFLGSILPPASLIAFVMRSVQFSPSDGSVAPTLAPTLALTPTRALTATSAAPTPALTPTRAAPTPALAATPALSRHQASRHRGPAAVSSMTTPA